MAIFLFFLPAGLVFFGLPMISELAFRIGAIDLPDGVRKLHTGAIPRLGGLWIFSSFALSALVLALFGNADGALLFPLLCGGALTVAFGVADDIFTLPPGVKFGLQTTVAALTVTLLPDDGVLGLRAPAAAVFLLRVGLLLLFMNAVNFSDGADGLACLYVLIAALSLVLRSATPDAGLLFLLLAFCLVGFLPANLPSASIYLGDSGSQVLGLLLGVGILSLPGGGKPSDLLLLALPIADLLFAVLRRLSSGRAPWSADRGHIHHLLADRGLSPWQVLGVLSLCALCFAALSLVLAAV